MTTQTPKREMLGGLTLPARLFVIAVTTLVIVAHGCHGDDEDHEPSVVLPAERERPAGE